MQEEGSNNSFPLSSWSLLGHFNKFEYREQLLDT